MSKGQSFWERELEKNSYWMIQQLSTSAFALSGFAFTSLSVFIGFYSSKPQDAAEIVSALFVCTVLFMLSGEMAREAYRIWKYIVSETIYLFTLSLLAISFWLFVASLPNLISPLAALTLLITIPYFIYRTIHNVYVAVKVR